MKFEKIKPGMTLYDVKKSSGLNKFYAKYDYYPVIIKEIYPETRRALVSWNGNTPRIFGEFQLGKLRGKPPKNNGLI